jgi:hypothetical protein
VSSGDTWSGLDGYGDICGGTRQQEPPPVAMTFEDAGCAEEGRVGLI